MYCELLTLGIIGIIVYGMYCLFIYKSPSTIREEEDRYDDDVYMGAKELLTSRRKGKVIEPMDIPIIKEQIEKVRDYAKKLEEDMIKKQKKEAEYSNSNCLRCKGKKLIDVIRNYGERSMDIIICKKCGNEQRKSRPQGFPPVLQEIGLSVKKPERGRIEHKIWLVDNGIFKETIEIIRSITGGLYLRLLKDEPVKYLQSVYDVMGYKKP